VELNWRAWLEKHWLSTLLSVIVVSFFIYLFVGMVVPAESDNPSIYDDEWQEDNYGGTKN